jgi:NTE family protein
MDAVMRALLLIALLLPTCLGATQIEPDRPRVCLALSGGGARGMAHIGVLKALEELQVPVDCIAGASMGSIVGGLYASGISADLLQSLIDTIDWEDVLTNELDWRDRRIQDKEETRNYFLGVEIGLGTDSSAAPAGILAGQNLQLLFRRLTAGLEIHDFDDLRVPFRAVATDLNNAESYVFDRGDLATAMRASMAIPLVFEPVKHDGRYLVDGGILNNLPVDVAREMGAKVVIAVNISSPFGKVGQSSSLFDVAYQSIDAALIQNTFKSLATADLVIAPELGDITAADFERGKEMIELGYQAVMQRRIFLDTLAVDEDTWAELRQQRRPPTRSTLQPIRYLEFAGNDRTATARLWAKTHELIGQLADPPILEKAAARLMALESFQSVDYVFIRNPEGEQGVRFLLQEKPWGPNYLSLGLNIQSDFDVATDFNLLARYRRLNLNDLGGEWSTDASLGTEIRIENEFYQPTDHAERRFASAYLDVSRLPLRLFASNDDQIAEYRIGEARLGFDIGFNFGNNRLRLGTWRGIKRADLQVGDPQLGTFDDDEGGYRLRFEHESLNQVHLGNRGAFVSLDYLDFNTGLGAEADYQRLDWQAYWRHPIWKGSTLHLESLGRWIESDNPLPLSAYVTLGGLDDLSGFPENGLIGDRAAAFRFGTLTNLQKFKLPLLGAPRILALAHAGHVWQPGESTNTSDLRYGITLGLTLDVLGTVLFAGTGHTQDGDTRLYLRIGSGL